jgi:hypothetical protein
MATKKPAQVEVFRPGIVPGIAGSAAMFIGMATYETDWYITVLFAISILAAVMVVFSYQSLGREKFVFAPLFVLITIYWNPIFRLNEGWDSGGQLWLLIQVAAAAVFFLGGFMTKTPATPR